MKEFKIAHERNDKMLKRYATSKRGVDGLSDAVVEDFADRGALSLKATNCRARIAFCRTACRRMKKAILPTVKAPAFFLTLAPDIFVTSLEEAQLYDWSVLHHWSEHVLAGFDYFGIVDAAPYTNTPTSTTQKVVSWHLHVFLWNCSRAEVDTLVAHLNTQYRPLLPGGSAAHASARLSWKSLCSRIIYGLKAPLRTYRVYPERDNSGQLSGAWIQKKYPHRPGEAAAVCRFMHGAEIDKLCIAGGAGQRLLEEITQAARAKIGRQERNRVARIIEAVLR